MKKVLYVLVLAMVLPVSSACYAKKSANQSVKTDWEIDGLKGRVKKITMVEYETREENGSLVKDRVHRTMTNEYDKHGRKVLTTGDYGLGPFKMTYTYGGDSVVIRAYEDGSDEPSFETAIYYTSWGDFQTEVHRSSQYPSVSRTEYSYNENHQKIGEVTYKNGELKSTTSDYVYDEQGHLTTYSLNDANGNMTMIYSYTYDENGLEASYTFIRLEGFVTGTYDYINEVDKQGNCIRTVKTSSYFRNMITEQEIEYY